MEGVMKFVGGLLLLAALAFMAMMLLTMMAGNFGALEAPQIELPSFDFAAESVQEQAEQAEELEVYSASDSAAVEAIELVEVDWANLAPTLDGNIFFSMRHPESQAIASSLLQIAGHSGKLPRKGDGRSNGSVRIYAGVEGAMGHIAILHVVSSNVSFAVLSAPIRSLGNACPSGSCVVLAKDAYINPADLVWTCAWIMASKISNGHGPAPMENWLDVGQGWQRWAEIQTRYQLVIELAEIPLPPLK